MPGGEGEIWSQVTKYFYALTELSARDPGSATSTPRRLVVLYTASAFQPSLSLLKQKRPNVEHIRAFYFMRRGWDLNPRSRFRDSCFQDRCNRPLCHLSIYILYVCRAPYHAAPHYTIKKPLFRNETGSLCVVVEKVRVTMGSI